MADYKKTYSKGASSKLATLKTASALSAAAEKEKIKKAEDLKKDRASGSIETSGSTETSGSGVTNGLFTHASRPDKAIAVLNDLIKDPRKGPKEFTIEELKDLQIYRDPKTTTVQEVIEILKTREVLPATKPVYFKLNYVIEPIPRPDIHKIYGLTAVSRKAWDKQYWKIDPDDSKYKVMHKLKNFVKQTGETIVVSVSGAPETKFRLVVHNETDNKYYDNNEFKTGFYSITGTIPSSKTAPSGFHYMPDGTLMSDAEMFKTNEGGYGEAYKTLATSAGRTAPPGFHYMPDGTLMSNAEHAEKYGAAYDTSTGENEENNYVATASQIEFTIPPSTTEKVYKIAFVGDVEFTTYGDSLPIHGNIEKPGYKITQLPNPTTTVRLAQSQGFISATGDLEITHLPGSKLSANTSTEGKYTVDLSVTSKKILSLNTGLQEAALTKNHVDGYSGEFTSTEIEGVELIASIKDNVGSIKGTITIGKTGLRSSEVLINPSSIFNLD